jgi:type I restriction enzyme S subunit
MKSIVGGGTPSKANPAYFQGDIPFMTVKDLHARFVADTQDHISEAALEDSASTLVPADTLIVATRMSLGKITRPLVPTAINQDLKALFLHDGIDKTYVEYLWRANESRIQGMGTGTTVKGIRLEDIRGLDVPLAPSAEQTRIAAHLDTLLTRIQSCNDRFDAIPALLKRFRQTIYIAATSGRLTEDWRVNGADKWTHERAADVCTKVQSGGTPKEGFSERGVPFLKVYNIVNQRVAFDCKPQYIDPSIHQGSMAKSRTQPGDVLMNIVGPPLGKVAIVPANHPSWNINQAITLFRPSERISTGWLYCILCSGVNISDIVHETRGSAGQINISLSQCRDFVFPVPPASEQAEIIRRVEALFALADRIEARATAARTHAQRLNALTLAKAFRGELVPQDPENEPASKLLKQVASATAIISKKKLKVSRPKATSMKYTPTSTREELLKLPLGVYSFDHLRSLIPAEYETLKNAIFLLLNEPSSGLKQVFDKAQNSLVFERSSK